MAVTTQPYSLRSSSQAGTSAQAALDSRSTNGTTVEPWKSSRSECSTLSWDSDFSPPPPAPVEPSKEPTSKTEKVSRPRRKGRVSARPQPPFVCFCGKQFKRHEHMSRHKATHSDELKYECHICGKGFRRQDVMHRHTQTHTRNNSNMPPRRKAPNSTAEQSQRQTAALSRADRACLPCKRAKLRCDGKLPCSRCVCHPNKDCSYQHGYGPASQSPSTSSVCGAYFPSTFAQYEQHPFGHSMSYPGFQASYYTASSDYSNSPASTNIHGFPVPPTDFAGGEQAQSARYYAREQEPVQRATSVPHAGGSSGVDQYCVPTQPVGTLETSNNFGLGLTPSSLLWSSKDWEMPNIQTQPYSEPTSTVPLPHPQQMLYQDHVHAESRQPSGNLDGYKWGSFSDCSMLSEAGTPPGSTAAYTASPCFIGTSAITPPPPPPAYQLGCQLDARDEAAQSSLPSSTDTAFYHFGTAAASSSLATYTV